MSAVNLLPGLESVAPISGVALNRARPDLRAAIDCTNESESLVFRTNSRLRAAIRDNTVTFPAQMAHLRSRTNGDRSERIVHLYFVSGWPVPRIRSRYQLSRQAINTILNEWRQRAIAAGFVQEIQPRSEEHELESLPTPTVDGTLGSRHIDIYPRPLVAFVSSKLVARQEPTERSASNSDFAGSASALEMAQPRRAVSTRANL